MAAWPPEFDDSFVYGEETDAFRTAMTQTSTETFPDTGIAERRLHP